MPVAEESNEGRDQTAIDFRTIRRQAAKGRINVCGTTEMKSKSHISKHENEEKRLSKNKTKPVVKYRQITRRLGGKAHKLRYKETLVGIITGQAARMLNEASERDESLTHSYNTKNMERRELWRSEILD